MCVACAALCARSRCFICLSNEPTQHFLTHPLPFPLSRLPLSCHPGQLSVVIYVPSLSRRPRIQMRLCPEAKKNCPSEPICSRCAAIVLNARPPGLSPRRVWLLLAPAPRNPEAGNHGANHRKGGPAAWSVLVRCSALGPGGRQACRRSEREEKS